MIPGLFLLFAGISDPALRQQTRNLILNPTTTTTTETYIDTPSDNIEILSRDLVYTVLGVGATALALVLIIILLVILFIWKKLTIANEEL